MQIGVITKNAGFLAPIMRELEKREHQVLRMPFSDSDVFNLVNLQRVLDSSDVCFFDFVHQPLIEATHIVPKTCRIVVRCHGIEVYYHCKNVNWNNVNHLVLTPPQLRRFEKLNIEPFPEVTTLPIGTDVEFLTPSENRVFGKKLLLVAATILPRKRVYTTIETVAPLLQQPNGFTLTIKGSSQTGFRDTEAYEYSMYIDELIDHLDIRSKVFHIDEVLPPEDYRQMFWDHDFIISNSMQEGYHKVIADAVACGMLPVIINWPYCDEVWPENWITYSQEELCEYIINTSLKSNSQKLKLSESDRQWLLDNGHDEREVAKQIVDILEAV